MSTDEILAELAKRGIQIGISGCGCCGSPYVRLAIDGVDVINDENVNIDNFPKQASTP